MVGESIAKTSVEIFSLDNPKKYLGQAQGFGVDMRSHSPNDDVYCLIKVVVVTGAEITLQKLIAIDNRLYQIISFDQPDSSYDYFKTISIKHMGDL